LNEAKIRADSKTQLLEQINAYLRSGNYSRALDLLRGTAAEFPSDTEFSKLESRAQDGVKRNAEAQRLITESQELFAQQKAAEAIQLLRQAYELDKNNSLARAILANALVEHAHSLVETDWLQAETLTNQALAVNPAHPTAKTVLNLIVEKKEKSSADDWVSQASKLQSSGDLFAALAWVAEGLAVHPNDPKLLQIQDAIHRDQSARRRQTRRRDMEDLRRMENEISAAADITAKQALASRIQGVAARYWTDGEILAIANSLLLRLGLIPKGSSSPSPHSKGAAVIFHVPRPSAAKPSSVDTSQISVENVPSDHISSDKLPQSSVSPAELPPGQGLLHNTPQQEVQITSPEPQSLPSTAAAPAELSVSAAEIASSSLQAARPTPSYSALILISSAAILLIAATFVFTRKHYAAPVATAAASASATASDTIGASTESARSISIPTEAELTKQAPSLSLPAPPVSSDTDKSNVALPVASSISNGHVVPISKIGLQDPPPQRTQIREHEPAALAPTLQPQPRFASLAIQGGVPGTTVLIDQTPVGTIQPDGALSVSTINPGEHLVELRKERFKPRQLKKNFIPGAATSLAAGDAALEAAPGELKINFAPVDAKVAIVNGEHLIMVNSGVPLNLAAGAYTLTARTADGFRSSSTLEVAAGQSKTLDLSLAPSGMSSWDDPAAWKQDKNSFVRKGGNFVLYKVPASGTFAFSALPAKGHLLQWVLNYSDAKNYVLFQMDENNFYRAVIHNGQKTDEIIVPCKGEKKSSRTLHIRVSSSEIIHQIQHGESWIILDRWTQPGSNLSSGKFGFYIPGDDQVALSNFAHYADLSIR